MLEFAPTASWKASLLTHIYWQIRLYHQYGSGLYHNSFCVLPQSPLHTCNSCCYFNTIELVSSFLDCFIQNSSSERAQKIFSSIFITDCFKCLEFIFLVDCSTSFVEKGEYLLNINISLKQWFYFILTQKKGSKLKKATSLEEGEDDMDSQGNVARGSVHCTRFVTSGFVSKKKMPT